MLDYIYTNFVNYWWPQEINKTDFISIDQISSVDDEISVDTTRTNGEMQPSPSPSANNLPPSPRGGSKWGGGVSLSPPSHRGGSKGGGAAPPGSGVSSFLKFVKNKYPGTSSQMLKYLRLKYYKIHRQLVVNPKFRNRNLDRSYLAAKLMGKKNEKFDLDEEALKMNDILWVELKPYIKII